MRRFAERPRDRRNDVNAIQRTVSSLVTELHRQLEALERLIESEYVTAGS